MDTYIRQLIVKSHQADLLREARDARLLATGRPERSHGPRLAAIGHLVHEAQLRLGGSHVAPVTTRSRFGREAGDGSVTGHMVRPAGA